MPDTTRGIFNRRAEALPSRSSGITRRELLTGTAALAAYSLLSRTAYGATDPLPADRLVYGGTWEGLVGVQGGIPSRTAQFGSTIAPYSGAPTTINNAIANCPAGQFVALGAGTFSLSGNIQINKSNVTLRGAVDANGAPATIISFTGGSTSIAFGSSGWDISNTAEFTTKTISSGASRGSSTVALSGAPSGLSVGMLMWINCAATSVIKGGNWSLWFGTRPFTQVVKVTGISGSNVSFTPPINADYLSDASPQVSYRTAADTVVLSGIENLKVEDLGGTSDSASHYIEFFGTDSCWARNIETYWASGGGVHHCYVYATYRTEIRHCNMHHVTPNSGSSSNAYCILPVHSSGLLIEDNYFHDVPNVMPMMGLSGSVFAYNYVTDLPYPASPNWLSQIVFFHGCHNHYNLFEGNWCPAHYNDATDSGQFAHSRNNVFFRGRMRGWDATGPKTANTQCITTESHHDNLVVAGCCMGEPGYHTQYNGQIFDFDSTSNATAARIANYNTVNKGIPAAEALAGGTALVTSYVHSSKPSWFGNRPWPWCDPSNFTQANVVTNLPAGFRAVNGTDPAPGGPSAPTNVRIIPG